jgi:hypothetical protein
VDLVQRRSMILGARLEVQRQLQAVESNGHPA